MTAPVAAAHGVHVAASRRVPAAVSVLEPFVEAGVFGESDVHLAATVARLAPGTPPEVLLAVALAARGPRLGHVCVVLDEVAGSVVADRASIDRAGDTTAALPWPHPQRWAAVLRESTTVVADPAAATAAPLRPLVWDGSRLYLQRYWCYEVAVAEALRSRARAHPGVDADQLSRTLDLLFGVDDEDAAPDGTHGDGARRRAVESALCSGVSVIAGGPGTGKTTTVASVLLAANQMQHAAGGPPLRAALAAPTGKAAARMTEAVRSVLAAFRARGVATAAVTASAGSGAGGGEPDGGEGVAATTIHRLLGWAPGTDFAHGPDNLLDADLVIIDETSMVDLSLMAHLLEAVRPDARLVLVGDPHQLASVEAGTVLGDIVAAAATSGSPLASHLTELTTVHRFGEGSATAELAAAIRAGDADAVMEQMAAPVLSSEVAWVPPDDVRAVEELAQRLVDAGVDIVTSARAGDGTAALAAASRIKLLAATRRGPLGLHAWSDRVEAGVADRMADEAGALGRGERWYVGRPILVTANDPLLGVANGDVGVVVARPAAGPEGSSSTDRSVAMAGVDGLRHLSPVRIDSPESWWAMTIHKSQGSEFPEVIVSLPDASSPILTRELLYTAVTRAKPVVTVVGSEEAIRMAVGRPVQRASGLRDRLSG